MDNNRHLGTRFIWINGQDGTFDGFKNISYEIDENFSKI
jgi:hypothetical protein